MAFLLLLADNLSFNDLKERMKFIVAGNHNYTETDGTNFVQSSLKSHSLWITLFYLMYANFTVPSQVDMYYLLYANFTVPSQVDMYYLMYANFTVPVLPDVRKFYCLGRLRCTT